MKNYEMIDDEAGVSVGYLLYYEKSNTFIIELNSGIDEWSSPILFSGLVKNNQYTVPRDISRMWVAERVIPSGRQNIGSILSNHNLKVYDELKFLEIADGRCSQDSIYIKRQTELPEYIKKRQKKNLTECYVSDDGYLLCFFRNNVVKKVELCDLVSCEFIDKLQTNPALFRSEKVGTDGYFLTFDDTYDIMSSELYHAGQEIPLSLNDFSGFVNRNIWDTTDSCRELECSRQNISYLIKHNHLTPVKGEVKGSLFLKGNVLSMKW